MGQMRDAKKTEGNTNSLQHKIRDGLALNMSDAAIANDAMKQYTHTPIQTVVIISEANFAP